MENTASGYGLLVKHGLSFWIKVVDMSTLFDTGQGNALQTSIRAERVDAIVISHDHCPIGMVVEVLR